MVWVLVAPMYKNAEYLAKARSMCESVWFFLCTLDLLLALASYVCYEADPSRVVYSGL